MSFRYAYPPVCIGSSSLYTVYPVVTYPFEPTANPAAPFRAVASSGISLHCVHQSLSILYSQQSFSRWSFPRYPPHKYPRLPITNPAASSLALPSKSERRYHTPAVYSVSSVHAANESSTTIMQSNLFIFVFINMSLITTANVGCNGHA